jgi:hypothetical protein
MSNTELKYLAWKDVQRERLNPHIDREMVVGDKIMLARVLCEKILSVRIQEVYPERHITCIQTTRLLRSLVSV